MTELFNTRYLLRGKFKGEGFEIANCDCEIVINSLDTSKLTANIYAAPQDVPIEFRNLPVKHWDVVSFVSSEYQENQLYGKIKTLIDPDSFGVIAELEVSHFTKYTVLHTNDFTTSHLTVNFTLTECHLFQLGRRAKVDVERGYLRGVDQWSGESENETIKLEFPWGSIELYRNILIREGKNESTIKTLAEPACISLTFKPAGLEKIDLLWNEAEKIVNTFLILLSYLDGQPIYWVRANGEAYNNELRIMLIEQFQGINKLYHKNNRKFDYDSVRRLRNLYCKLIQYFLTLNDQEAKSITTSLNRYLLATNAELPSEVTIMLLQSAIEVLISYYYEDLKGLLKSRGARGRATISMKVVALSQFFKLDLLQYYHELPIDSIKNGREDIPFVKIRNELTHEGNTSNATAKECQKEFSIMDDFYRKLIYNILLTKGTVMEGFKIV